ncbi:unnamed protein product [Blepharisma stoltei]|uniref:TAFII28-like protein domain-containing protein n=1 Tax=Blepharisma stoltei TaxID=1481888 RepID=A0AAU9JI82_9CILI|nr:unnamed protein product [Blepharisma stoltei]
MDKNSEDLDISDRELLEEDDDANLDEEQIRLQSILERATEEQRDRYEVMHETYLWSPTISASNEKLERIVAGIIGGTPQKDILSAVAAAAKIYVGELVEEALEVAKINGDVGCLATNHVQEARRRLKKISKRIL